MPRRKQVKVSERIRKYIESEVEYYGNMKKELEQTSSNIVNDKSNEDYGVKIGIKSPELCNGQAESKALKLLTSTRLEHLEKTMRAIETVLTRLPEEKYKLVQIKYWSCPQCLTDDGIAQKLRIDRATYYDWRNGIIIAIGKEMGVIA